jgi:hypothetical protein
VLADVKMQSCCLGSEDVICERGRFSLHTRVVNCGTEPDHIVVVVGVLMAGAASAHRRAASHAALFRYRTVGARRGARLVAGSVSERPSPIPACAFRYAPGSPSAMAKRGGRSHPSTLLVPLLLLGQEPRLIEGGCRIHGFPLRPGRCTRRLPPFAVSTRRAPSSL